VASYSFTFARAASRQILFGNLRASVEQMLGLIGLLVLMIVIRTLMFHQRNPLLHPFCETLYFSVNDSDSDL
jgi:hypothetical protein